MGVIMDDLEHALEVARNAKVVDLTHLPLAHPDHPVNDSAMWHIPGHGPNMEKQQ